VRLCDLLEFGKGEAFAGVVPVGLRVVPVRPALVALVTSVLLTTAFLANALSTTGCLDRMLEHTVFTPVGTCPSRRGFS
jgi:hypothetical protein